MGKTSKKNRVKTRDYAMVKVINGATKAGVHVDRKKEVDRQVAREKVKANACKQCGFPIYEDSEEHPDFCSFSCEEYFTDPTSSLE